MNNPHTMESIAIELNNELFKKLKNMEDNRVEKHKIIIG